MDRAKKANSRPSTKQKKYWQEFGAYLHEKRQLSGLSMEAVSAYIEASPQTLLAYESGEKPIPVNRIYALSNCLNISPEEILRNLANYQPE